MPSESRQFARTPIYLAALFLLWVVVYGAALFRPPLLDDADSVHAEAAREILTRHDWVTLHANGIRYLEKAPLFYWAMAISFRLFGVHDWWARLPLALGVLALLWAVYFSGRRVFGEKAGFYAALASGFALGTFIFTRFLIPDVLVGLWLLLSLDFFLRTFDGPAPSRLSCWGLALVCALNVLTKGVIGLVFPLATISLYLLLTRPSPDAPYQQHVRFSAGRCTLAHPCWIAEPNPRKCARLFLVLLRQRAFPALSQQARAAGLRDCAVDCLLGSRVRLAVPLV